MERYLKSSTRIEKGTTVVDVEGQIDLGSSPGLRKTLLNCLLGTDRVAVNLMAVKYIDSSGIASLVEGLKASRDNGARLILYGLSSSVREVMELSRLQKIFEIYDNEEQALAS